MKHFVAFWICVLLRFVSGDFQEDGDEKRCVTAHSSSLINNFYGAGNSSLHEVEDIISKMIAIAELKEVDEANSVEYLNRVLSQLRSGKIHAAIVGVVKAGKSTTINALVGQSFLPSAVRPETAERIRLVHDPSKPNGELWGIPQQTESPVLLAEGQRDVHDWIHKMNDAERNGKEYTSEYSQFELKVAFKFLYDECEIAFDLSDLPGLGEGASQSSDQVQHILKNISAFIILVDGRKMRTDTESNLFQELVSLYPDLLKRLERVLIVVNVVDGGHNLDASVTQRPDDIPDFVTEYLQIPRYLGVKIPPENILLLDARWALRSREWLANRSIMTNPQDIPAFLGTCGQIQTVLAVNNQQDLMEIIMQAMQAKQFSEDQLQSLCLTLEKVSLIKNFEAKLKTMLVHNGHRILLESAIDSALGEAKKLESRIKVIENAEQQHLTDRSALVQSEVELVDIVEYITGDHITVLQRLPQAVETEISVQLQVLISTMHDSVNSRISTKLMEMLQNTRDNEKMDSVRTVILSVKPHVSNAVADEMKRSWEAACKLIQDTQTKVVKETCAQLKVQLLNSLSSQLTKADQSMQSTLSLQVSEFLEMLSSELDKVQPSNSKSVLPAFPNSAISAFPITDKELCQYVIARKETRYENKRRVKRFWGIEYGYYHESVPYTVDLYSPNIPALQIALSSTLTKSRIEQFQLELSQVINSTAVSQKTKQKIESALATPLKVLRDNISDDQAMLRASEQKVKLLREQLEELETTEKQLRKQYE